MAINVSVEEGGNDPVNVEVSLAYPSHTHTVTDITNVAEDIQDLVGAMVSSNSESGISVTYDDVNGKLNFDVGDFSITMDGDVSGTGTVTNLGNVTITTTVADNSHNHVSTNITDFTEAVQDAAQAMITAASHAGLSVSYDDLLNTLTFNVNDPVITIAGDATGSATMTNLGDTTITVDLSNTGVSAGTYGDANSVGQFQVDEDGRITSASNVDINIVSTQVSDFTEAAQDSVAPLLNHGFHTNVTASYDDENNRIVLTGSGNVLSVNGEVGNVVLTTGDIAEGNDGDPSTTNLWFTTDRAQDAAGTLLDNASAVGIDITYNSSTNALVINNTGVLSVSGATGEIDAVTVNGAVELSFPLTTTFPQDVVINGNLTVNGTETIINATNLNVTDQIIVLNDGFTGLPDGLISGLQIMRGDSGYIQLVWVEDQNSFATTSDGITYKPLSQVDDVNGFTGQVTLTTDEIPQGLTNLYYSDTRVDEKFSSFFNLADPHPTIDVAYVAPDPLTSSPSQFFAEVKSAPKTEMYVKNGDALEVINAGSVVYISGYDGNTPTVLEVDPEDPTKMPGVGIANTTILGGDFGYVTTSGQCFIDTGLIPNAAVGLDVYVAPQGFLTVDTDAITYNLVPQKIGRIIKLSTAAETADGIIYVYGPESITEPPRLQLDHIYVGTSLNSEAVPVEFSIENININPVDLISNLPSTMGIDPGAYRYVNEDGNVYINSGGWRPLSFVGHNHNSTDILDYSEAWQDEAQFYFANRLALNGLNFTYDDVNNIGVLGVDSPNVSFTFNGDVSGTFTTVWEQLGDIEFAIGLTFNEASLANYTYDLLNHTRHENITVELDLTPVDSSGPQIILNAPTPYTQEEIQDFVSPLLDHTNHTNVTVTYDDGPNQILLSVPDSVDLIQFGTRPAVNGNVTVGFNDIVSALGYTPLDQTDGEKATDLIAPAIVHDNHVNVVTIYDDDNDRIVLEVQTAGAASVGSLTNSWWLGA